MDFLEGLLYIIWRGIAIGVIISAPMGPVGILCVQRTLEKGRRVGLLTGVGAAVSDLFYCLLTGFGLSFIEEFLKENQNVIQIVGSVVLVVFGVYLFRSNPARTLKKPGEERDSGGKTILSGFLFTFSNPLIIFLIIGLFARFNFLLPEITFIHYIIGFIAIIAGALMWWWVVTFFVDKVRSHFNLRSMWLINKITGGIIMIFALVGVITAVTGMVSAAERTPVCLNSRRGFGSLAPDGGSSPAEPLKIVADSSDTAVRFLPLDQAEDFIISMRVANLHNASGKRYPVVRPDGGSGRQPHIPWGLLLCSGDETMRITFRTLNDPYDDVRDGVLEVSLHTDRADDVPVPDQKWLITDGVDFFTGENAFRLIRRDGMVTLLAGNRHYDSVIDAMPAVAPDSVGIWVAPGGCILLDDIVLETQGRAGREAGGEAWTPDRLKAYLRRSADAAEGYWQVFDRQLDDNSLRCGGAYTLACVRSAEGGYDFLYVGGARINAPEWTHGRLKARFAPTGFGDVFDVTWFDPQGHEISGEIKAQREKDIMTLHFPDHSSTLRLRKIRNSLSTHDTDDTAHVLAPADLR
ncbi:MAG: LysE family translocator [Muribaculaceae bacterium]|nr:LysE family translocator [Muribaculaceae bacterium]